MHFGGLKQWIMDLNFLNLANPNYAKLTIHKLKAAGVEVSLQIYKKRILSLIKVTGK